MTAEPEADTWGMWGSPELPETRLVALVRVTFEVEDEGAVRGAREAQLLAALRSARFDPVPSPDEIHRQIADIWTGPIEDVLQHLVEIPDVGEIPGVPSRWIGSVRVVPRASPEGQP